MYSIGLCSFAKSKPYVYSEQDSTLYSDHSLSFSGRYYTTYLSSSWPFMGGGGAVRGSEGDPADDDDLASEKGHLLAKRALFFP